MDGRWTTRYAVVRDRLGPVALLPYYAPRFPRWFDQAYNVSALLEPGARLPAEASKWLLVGGRADRACGMLRASRPRETIETAASLAGALIYAEARRLGRTPAALYVSESERPFLIHALGAACTVYNVANEARLPIVGEGESDYLAALPSSHRSVVRRDWRERARRGLVARAVSWTDVLDGAASLIAAVARAHGSPDHPLLIQERLARWLENVELTPVAFVVETPEQAILAISFGWVWRDIFQVYEVGLAERCTPGRHLAYVEALIYAPLRYAQAAGCSSISLGLDAAEPKRLRGATITGSAVLVGGT